MEKFNFRNIGKGPLLVGVIFLGNIAYGWNAGTIGGLRGIVNLENNALYYWILVVINSLLGIFCLLVSVIQGSVEKNT